MQAVAERTELGVAELPQPPLRAPVPVRRAGKEQAADRVGHDLLPRSHAAPRAKRDLACARTRGCV